MYWLGSNESGVAPTVHELAGVLVIVGSAKIEENIDPEVNINHHIDQNIIVVDVEA